MKTFEINQADYDLFYKNIDRGRRNRVLHAFWLFPLLFLFLWWLLFYIDSVHNILGSAFAFILIAFTAFYHFYLSFKVTNKDINNEKNTVRELEALCLLIEMEMKIVEVHIEIKDQEKFNRICVDYGMTDTALLMQRLAKVYAAKEAEMLQSMMWIKYFNEVSEKTFWAYFTSWKWLKK
jgi:hypothetical protein